jgi:hypothetical protein
LKTISIWIEGRKTFPIAPMKSVGQKKQLWQ